MPTPSPVVVCSGLTFAWPDATPVFSGLSIAIGPGRTGLIGLNGSGKSTLLRLIAGDLRPARGSVSVTGELGYLPQNVTLGPGLRVDDVLGIKTIRNALNALEAGDASPENFALVGADWDVEERVDLPETAVPAGRTVLRISVARLRYGAGADLAVRGPERIALTGRNGAGKTTLLRTIVGEIPPVSGEVALAVPARYLPQRLDLLDPGLTVAQNVARRAPAATDNQVRAGWPGSCSGDGAPTSSRARSRAASSSGPRSPRCCWRSRRRSFCCWTSRRTAWTWRACGSCPGRCCPIPVR